MSELLSKERLSSKCELKDRRDVVNKTLLRAIRRYFLTTFKESFPQKRFRDNEKCVAHFMTSVEQFSAKYLGIAPPQLLRALFGNLVNQKMFIKNPDNMIHPETALAARFVTQLVAC